LASLLVYNNFMNLHRTAGKPDWDAVKSADRNAFQKVGAATYTIVTPANVITVIGLGIVFFGLAQILAEHYWIGLIALAVGRLLDIVDGVVADKTGTKSPTGEIFDAVADKIGTLLTIVVLFAAQIAEPWLIILLLIPQVLTPLVTFYKKQKRIEIHPTRQGKLSMATSWVAIVGLLVTKAMDGSLLIADISYTLVGVSFLLGVYALWQYITGRDQS